MSAEAPDWREQEDCPSAVTCRGGCDQHGTTSDDFPANVWSDRWAHIWHKAAEE